MVTKQKQKKLFLLLLPVVVIPLAILFFYGLGGGRPAKKINAPQKGINTTLPDGLADSQSPLDKLSIYRQAEKDSAKMKEEIDRDPFFSKSSIADQPNPFSPAAKEQGMLQKLALLQEQLKNNGQPGTQSTVIVPPAQPFASSAPVLQKPVQENDPEMEELNGMLDKVLDIQHPERVKKASDAQHDAPKRASVRIMPVIKKIIQDDTDGSTDQADESTEAVPPEGITAIANRFYEMPENGNTVQQGNASIAASVQETQSVMNGSEVKLRLDQDITVMGTNIPAGTFVFARAQLQMNRLLLSIENIQYNNLIVPVSLDVYSYDGMMGVPLTDAITEEVAKQGADKSMQSLQLTTLSPTIGAQAAAAGIETAKSLIGRKTRLIKIKLKGGHPVLLRNSNK